MKFLILGVLAAFISSSYCSKKTACFGRKEHRELIKMRENMECNEPTEQFVQIPVPEGFQYLMPSMVKVKRCNGYCWKMKRDCLPTETQTKSVRVEAMKMVQTMEKECMMVDVEEHLSCGCNCIAKEDSCSDKQVFMDKYCSCICKDGLEEDCEAEKGMFAHDTCECIRQK